MCELNLLLDFNTEDTEDAEERRERSRLKEALQPLSVSLAGLANSQSPIADFLSKVLKALNAE